MVRGGLERGVALLCCCWNRVDCVAVCRWCGLLDDRTPLFNAATGGHVDTVRHLLASGATVNISDTNGRTALHW